MFFNSHWRSLTVTSKGKATYVTTLGQPPEIVGGGGGGRDGEIADSLTGAQGGGETLLGCIVRMHV